MQRRTTRPCKEPTAFYIPHPSSCSISPQAFKARVWSADTMGRGRRKENLEGVRGGEGSGPPLSAEQLSNKGQLRELRQRQDEGE